MSPNSSAALCYASGKLPADIRLEMEDLFGAHLSNIAVHLTPFSVWANKQRASVAFTIGNDIFLGADAPPPTTRFGRQLLAHELAHVMQKRLGETRQTEGNDRVSEQEALAAGDRVSRGLSHTCEVPSAPDTASCWGEAGHYYTSHFVLQAAGVSYELAEQLAFCAQMADEVDEMDAIEQGKRYLKWSAAKKALPEADSILWDIVFGGGIRPPKGDKMERYKQDALYIQRGLHCLTGAISSNETGWRIYWLENKDETPSIIAGGLGIHALGDSFSHRLLTNEHYMYDSPFGHSAAILEPSYKLKHSPATGHTNIAAAHRAWHRAHAPDEIDQRPHLYKKYAKELFSVAKYRWGTSEPLTCDVFENAIDEIALAAGEKNQIAAVRAVCARHCKAISEVYFPEKNETKSATSFLREMKSLREMTHFMDKYDLPRTFLDSAKHYSRKWAYKSVRASAAPRASPTFAELKALEKAAKETL